MARRPLVVRARRVLARALFLEHFAAHRGAEPGRCEASIAHRRKVTNHIGTVHAIALCNLAEFAGGLMTDVSIPASMRWIPKGMTVEYLGKANGTMRAVATPDVAPVEAAQGYEMPVTVVVTDPGDAPVFRARIAMWVSPKR